LSAELQKAKARYGALQDEARRVASLTMRDGYGMDVRIVGWSHRAQKAVADHWKNRRVDWDWPEIFRRNREPKTFDLAIWTPDDRLVALVLARMSTEAVTLALLEGDPNSDCPFRGRRALIALEACANYAQGAGVAELRIQPLNSALAAVYQDRYGFGVVTPKGQKPYYVKRV
jgi:hypothetical protein